MPVPELFQNFSYPFYEPNLQSTDSSKKTIYTVFFAIYYLNISQDDEAIKLLEEIKDQSNKYKNYAYQQQWAEQPNDTDKADQHRDPSDWII